MKLNKLKKGEIYYCESNPNYFKNSIFIFKFNKAEKDNGQLIETLGILRTNKKEFDFEGLNDGHHHNLRPATLKEKIWLEQCKKAGKFISKELALEQYEKEFKLPEKWCIKIKEEYKEDLNKYLHSNSDKYPKYRKKWNLSTATEKYFFYSEATSETGAHSSFEYYPEFTEITFEQFKQYVLKENTIEKWSKGTYVVFLEDNIQYNNYKKEKIPEYIETIKVGLNNTNHKDCKKTLNINESNGKILKVIRRDLPGENSNYDCYVCEDGYVIYVEYCIPSTKKAYEKQENIVGAQESVVSGDEIIINNEKELPLKTSKKNNKKIDIYVENIPKVSNSKNEILLTIKKRKKL